MAASEIDEAGNPSEVVGRGGSGVGGSELGGAGIKWVAVDNLHLTLKFLGETSVSRLVHVSDAVREAVTGFRRGSFDIRGLGTFPPRGEPRVVWAGVFEPEPMIGTLAGALERSLAAQGFPREKRRFTPHITIGRVRTGRNFSARRRRSKPGFDSTRGVDPWRGLRSCLDGNADRFFGSETVEAVSVMRSELRTEGPRYEEMERFALEKI